MGEGRRLERRERVRGWERERERNRREGGISTALLCDWKFNREREGGRGRRSRMLKLDERRREREPTGVEFQG